MDFDLIIEDGFIIDGSGNPGFCGEVGIKDGKVKQVGSRVQGKTNARISAEGLAVTPGFIDPHVHEEIAILTGAEMTDYIKQGVTTLISGNCGHSVHPGPAEAVYEYMSRNGLLSDSGEAKASKLRGWSSLKEYRELVKELGLQLNFGILLGHGTIRWLAMGGLDEGQPDEEELAAMKAMVAAGMTEGALGISTGLSYLPGRMAKTDELIELAAVVAEHDGTYASHIRYELGPLAAVEEVIEIAKKSGVRSQVSHLTPGAPDAYQAISDARQAGIEIAVDMIPKSSGHCTSKRRMLQFIRALTPSLFEKDVSQVQQAIKDPESREKIKEQSGLLFKEEWENILFINTDDQSIEGKSAAQLAETAGAEPADFVLDMLAADDRDFTIWLGGFSRGDFPGSELDQAIADNPLVMVGSDRIFDEGDDPYAWYELFRSGAFPFFFKMMREQSVRLEEIVRRVTSLPAQQFRLSSRGLLKPGMTADIAVIDFDNYRYPDEETIDYGNPFATAEGVKHLLVNGQLVYKDGQIQKERPGKFVGLNGRDV
ncbi:MAG: N-acyl-D-amino-acid deacylase family protein [Bacillota bacterium]